MSAAVLITGATSSIARATAMLLGAKGRSLVLAARDLDEARVIAHDLRIRFNIAAEPLAFDAEDPLSMPRVFDEAVRLAGGELEGVLLCHGYLPDQRRALEDPAELRRTVDVNFTSCAALVAAAADAFERRQRGFIAVVSSVAGDRGRASNHVYGGAKAGLNAVLQGMRQRLAKSGVAVITIKPGFVDTAMTWGKPGMFLVTSPERAARDIERAIGARAPVVYTPWFWRFIMLIIRAIPEPVFKRLTL